MWLAAVSGHTECVEDLRSDGREVVDLRGEGCAGVLIRLAALARDAASRGIVVLTDDLGAPEELPAWCRMTKHRFDGSDPANRYAYYLTLNPQP